MKNSFDKTAECIIIGAIIESIKEFTFRIRSIEWRLISLLLLKMILHEDDFTSDAMKND